MLVTKITTNGIPKFFVRRNDCSEELLLPERPVDIADKILRILGVDRHIAIALAYPFWNEQLSQKGPNYSITDTAVKDWVTKKVTESERINRQAKNYQISNDPFASYVRNQGGC